ncbi:MAG: OmpH family outer membrane protein [Boseongicola sp.]
MSAGRLVVSLIAVAGLCLGSPAAGQDGSLSLPPPILTIDQDRLFAETLSGETVNAELEEKTAALGEENSRIEAALIDRERALTEQRPSLPPDEFRALADEFDVDVQRIRAEQDEKAREITQESETARQQFLSGVAGIISGIVRERGALVVLDRRDVFLSADRIDITDEAIVRINAATEESE